MLALLDAPAASMACCTMRSSALRSSRAADAATRRSLRCTSPVAVILPFHAVSAPSSSKLLAMVVTRGKDVSFPVRVLMRYRPHRSLGASPVVKLSLAGIRFLLVVVGLLGLGGEP